MAQGLDYSYSHPDVGCVARAGYTFVARYIGDPDPNSAKYLDAPELASIRAAGLSVVVVRETSEGFMFTDSGAAHARAARAHCNQLGLWGIPIYYALDVDPRGLTSAQGAAVTRFLQDAAAADGGGHNVGIYGSDDALDRWAGQPFCWWGWQTYAWSGGRVSPRAHFRQYLNGQSVCGGTVDLNETYYPDFGQWPRPFQEEDMTPEEHDWLYACRNALVGASGDRIGDLWNREGAILEQLTTATDGRLGAIWAKLEEILAAIDANVDEVAVAQAVLAVLTPEAIAAALPPPVTPVTATDVANLLHARLAPDL